MTIDSGRDNPALAKAEPVSRLGPSGFDPARITLEHFSHAPITVVESREQSDRDNLRGKPSGIWISVKGEDDWPSWCDGEQWGLGTLAYSHAVRLSPAARIMWVDGLEQFDWFAAEYRAADPRYSRAEIDWSRVAASFDGIVIAPYLWERRFEDWYYGWDCASGCIWNANAIEAFGPAIATEAQRAETPQSGSVHEGAARRDRPKATAHD